jgi:uncharacterized phage protein (TIGR01671 family)
MNNADKFEAESRIIKFRAWDNKEKKWLLGYDYPNLGGFSMFGECMLFEEWSSILNRFHLQREDRSPSDLKLMQFSGILDKNQKPIYEGDIVNDGDNGNGIVVFQSGCFFMNYGADVTMEFLGLKLDEFKRLQAKRIVEVVGNIYDNPQLIETI